MNSRDAQSDPVEPFQRAGMRNAIFSQSLAASSYMVFSNGILLVYMTAFEISSARIFVCLSMPTLVSAFLQWPFAVVADSFGKKLIGLTGTVLQAASWFALLSPIVSQSIRGRFFGRMRFCWQLVAIIVTGVFALFLTESAPPSAPTRRSWAC